MNINWNPRFTNEKPYGRMAVKTDNAEMYLAKTPGQESIEIVHLKKGTEIIAGRRIELMKGAPYITCKLALRRQVVGWIKLDDLQEIPAR